LSAPRGIITVMLVFAAILIALMCLVATDGGTDSRDDR
jgi:hypothetical protein